MRSLIITCLHRLSSSAIVCSAVDSVGPSGVFTTRIPCRVAASRSIRSTPMPVRAIIRRRGPMRSITSFVTNVSPATIIASAVDASVYQSLRSPTLLTEIVARPSGCSTLPVQTCACAMLVLFFSPVVLPACTAQVSRCSRDHTANIGRHADHLEALAHAFSRGLSITTKNAKGNVMFPCTHLNTFQCLYKFGFSAFGTWCETELGVEIVRSDECHIYPRHRENLIEILERLCTLNLDSHNSFIVRCPRIIWPVGDAEPVRAESPADTATAGRRILRVLYHPLRLFTRIDHRDYYAPCPCVQRPLEPLDAIPRNTHDGSTGPCIGDGRNHICHEHRILSAVFHVHDQPIKAEPRHDSCRGNAGKAQPCPQHGFAPLEFFFHLVCTHLFFPIKSLVLH